MTSFGVIMIAMAIGNVWGGKLADKSATPDKLYRRLIIAAIWIALIPFVGRCSTLTMAAARTVSTNSDSKL